MGRHLLRSERFLNLDFLFSNLKYSPLCADNKSSPVNVRVVGATNEVLQGKMKDGTFREDLYYRLAVIPVEIPPLRERLEDVPLLVNHFLQKQASASGGEPKTIDPLAVDILVTTITRATCASWRTRSNARAPYATKARS
ncbi:MAG: sigma 54-interacting transcriptional regulator [Verrucomicrobiota bacterium]